MGLSSKIDRATFGGYAFSQIVCRTLTYLNVGRKMGAGSSIAKELPHEAIYKHYSCDGLLFSLGGFFFVVIVGVVIGFIQRGEFPKNWGGFFYIVGVWSLFVWIPLKLVSGLRRKQEWARISVIILAAIGILNALLMLGLSGVIPASLVVFSVSVWTLWSMSRRRVKQAFEETKAVEKEIRQA